MDLLLVDISNTRTKLAPSDGETIGEKFIVPTKELSEKSLRKLLKAEGLDDPKRVVVSSVVPKRNDALTDLWGDRVTLIDHHTDLGIRIDYPFPEQIGADRLANAVATASIAGSPSIAVDFGTAVTFDVIGQQDGQPAYLGGVIAPGLEAMTNYLHKRTALLPKLDLEQPPSAIGKSTVHAMLTGAVIGYRGLVKEILAEVEAEMNCESPVPVLATGGNAHLICGGIPQIQTIESNLTLEGLRIIGGR